MSKQAEPYTLWGMPCSLYTGKIRSYLLKKGVAFREVFPLHPDFMSRIVPAVKSMVVPVLESPEGDVVQDTTDMIDFVDARHPEPALQPSDPVQRVVSLLFDAFGSEGLLPTAMHYRWSYRDYHEQFLRMEFGRGLYAGSSREARLEAGLQFMTYFSGFLPSLGVHAETIPALEAAYADLLDAFDVHFQSHPYLLGGRPCYGDFGLIGPLYAHLARDPYPATLMKNRAPNLYRWTERMNLEALVDGEFFDRPAEYPADAAIPETLLPVLRLLFADWGPVVTADARCFREWIAADPSRPAGTVVAADGARRVHPTVGRAICTLRGVEVRRDSAPHGLWLFDRAARLARTLEGDAHLRLDALLAATGGRETMSIDVGRAMKREDCQLVLA